MDSSEFPSLSDSTSASGNVDKSTLLGSSWAEVAQLNDAPETVEGKENNKDAVDHRPGAWEAQKEKATFADVAGHENKQAEEFPTPQESLAQSDTVSLPTSGGVGDLFHSNTEQIQVEGKRFKNERDQYVIFILI
jgi:hypothetical protein